jgi:glycosyltransferase involved in cell wall biosynthesis
MPCLNEAETLATCVDKAMDFLRREGISGEILVADNGSVDGSQAIARQHGARLVEVCERGYGAALTGGIRAARGRYVVMGDADDSYDFTHLEPFVEKLRDGYDLVMGNRFRGGIAPGAMPALHKYLGNPVLTGIGRLFFSSPCGDFHCGLRGFNKASIEGLDLHTTGMEFASEMVVKSSLQGLRVTEVPTTLSKDGRSRPPHLRSWRDGWRHLRFLLMYSPRWLFLYPGLFLVLAGLGLMLAVVPSPLIIGSVMFDVHTLLIAMGAILAGIQLWSFFLLSKQFAINEKLLPISARFATFSNWMSLERAVVLGVLIGTAGLTGVVAAVVGWGLQGFGTLNYQETMRLLVPSLTALLAGVQIIGTGFMASILDLKLRK